MIMSRSVAVFSFPWSSNSVLCTTLDMKYPCKVVVKYNSQDLKSCSVCCFAPRKREES